MQEQGLDTDDCRRTYEELSARGVEFTEEPNERFYGIDEANARLAELRPDAYGNWSPEQLTAALKPYGIKEDSDGNLWIACNGAPCLYKMDAATMDLTEVKLPIPATTSRRLPGSIWSIASTPSSSIT